MKGGKSREMKAKPSERYSRQELAADPHVQALIAAGLRRMEAQLEAVKTELEEVKAKKQKSGISAQISDLRRSMDALQADINEQKGGTRP